MTDLNESLQQMRFNRKYPSFVSELSDPKGDATRSIVLYPVGSEVGSTRRIAEKAVYELFEQLGVDPTSQKEYDLCMTAAHIAVERAMLHVIDGDVTGLNCKPSHDLYGPAEPSVIFEHVKDDGGATE